MSVVIVAGFTAGVFLRVVEELLGCASSGPAIVVPFARKVPSSLAGEGGDVELRMGLPWLVFRACCARPEFRFNAPESTKTMRVISVLSSDAKMKMTVRLRDDVVDSDRQLCGVLQMSIVRFVDRGRARWADSSHGHKSKICAVSTLISAHLERKTRERGGTVSCVGCWMLITISLQGLMRRLYSSVR